MMPFQAMRLKSSGAAGFPFFGMPTMGGGTNVSASARLGWVFTISGPDLICNTLRVQVQTGTSGTELVMLHRNSDGALIAQANIVTNMGGAWFTGTVSNFTLQSGVTYTVSSRRGGTARLCRQTSTSTYYPALTGLTTGCVTGVTDTIPTTVSAQTYRTADFGWV